MRRRDFLATAAAPLVAAPTRPNLVFVLVDDLRFNALGCTGHPWAQSPNVDRLAREGTRFTSAYVTTPLCSPSRGSFLTGQYVHTHGITDNTQRGPQSHKLVTFPALLRQSGYETAYVGKWHMGNDDAPRPGFDRWVSFPGQGVYENPAMNIDGEKIKAQGYMTDLLSGHAVEFARKKREKPFCLYLAHKAVHGPFTPAARHKDLFTDKTVQRGPNAEDNFDGRPALASLQSDRRYNPNDELVRNQLRCLAAIDEGVGELMKAVPENTLFIFTSDNGYFWGDHKLGDKRWAYEESVRIPMVARWPGRIRAGSEIAANALNIDIGPTMLDAGGAQRAAAMQGRSLLPLFQGKAKQWRKTFLTEYFRDGNFPQPPWQAAQDERWKYIHYTEKPEWDELYDRNSDPHELKNLIGDPAAARELTRLKKELAALV